MARVEGSGTTLGSLTSKLSKYAGALPDTHTTNDQPSFPFSDIEASFRLAAYCEQLDMLLERLDRHVPADEDWTPEQRRWLSRAVGFMRASRTRNPVKPRRNVSHDKRSSQGETDTPERTRENAET